MYWFGAAWQWYAAYTSTINPIIGFLSGVGAFITAIMLARSSVRNAHTASLRHDAQTKADHQRRLTESFSKAIEQLGSDKMEVRLSGIHHLGQIAESEDHYWVVIETLTAFVRHHASWKEREASAATSTGDDQEGSEHSEAQQWPEPATDIAAILSVICRRPARRELREGRWIDLRKTDLRGANLDGINLTGANLSDVHLEGARLNRANLRSVNLCRANLEGARLGSAHLEGAELIGTNFKKAFLGGAHVSARVEDLLVVLEDAMAQVVAADEFPDVLNRIEFGGVRRQRQQDNVIG